MCQTKACALLGEGHLSLLVSAYWPLQPAPGLCTERSADLFFNIKNIFNPGLMSFGGSLMIGMGCEKFSFFGKYPCRVRRPWPQARRAPARKDRPSCAHCEVLHNKSAARNVLQRTEPEPAARKVLLCTVREPAARSQQPLSELTAGLPSTPNHQPCLCEAVLVL